MIRVWGRVAAERLFKAARARRRLLDFIRRRTRLAAEAGRREAGGGGTFPTQAQVFGPEARVERRFGQMGRAEIVLGRKMSDGPNLIGIFSWKIKMSDGPNLIGIFSWKIMIWVLGCIVLGLKYL